MEKAKICSLAPWSKRIGQYTSAFLLKRTWTCSLTQSWAKNLTNIKSNFRERRELLETTRKTIKYYALSLLQHCAVDLLML